MLKSVVIGSGPFTIPSEAKDVYGSRTSHETRLPSVVCSSSRAFIPKLEPFSRTKFERAVKDRPLIEKSESELSDYCSTLEGDDSYSCWRAYFELKDLESLATKEEIEKLILQAGGVKSLIGLLHGISAIQKGKVIEKLMSTDKEVSRICPIPDGIPKTLEELDEEAEGKLPDSPYTRLLRARGKFPAWYSPAPDHETD